MRLTLLLILITLVGCARDESIPLPTEAIKACSESGGEASYFANWAKVHFECNIGNNDKK